MHAHMHPVTSFTSYFISKKICIINYFNDDSDYIVAYLKLNSPSQVLLSLDNNALHNTTHHHWNAMIKLLTQFEYKNELQNTNVIDDIEDNSTIIQLLNMQ